MLKLFLMNFGLNPLRLNVQPLIRYIYTTSALAKGVGRVRLKVDTVKASREVALDMKGKRNRNLWEKNKIFLESRKGKYSDDDVFFMSLYELKLYEVESAINCLKDVCLDPALLNSPNAPLNATFNLNMRTKKKTKFVNVLNILLQYPHKLDFLQHKRILVFCSDPNLVQRLTAQGAWMAGGDELVEQVSKGDINYEQFDIAISDLNMVKSLKKLRLVLRDKMPQTQLKQIGDNIEEILKSNQHGLNANSTKLEGIMEEASVSACVGLINWPTEKLNDNLEYFLKCILENSSSQIVGDVVFGCSLECRPCVEKFNLNIQSMVEAVKRKSEEQNVSESSQSETTVETTI